jgi:hypothetical protein
MVVRVLRDMPEHGHDAGTKNGDKHDLLYEMSKKWVKGGDINI